MSDCLNKVTRPCRKRSDFFLVAALMSLILVILGQLLGANVLAALGVQESLSDWLGSDNLGTFLADYLLTWGAWAVILLALIIPKENRPMLKELAPNKSGNNLKGILAGFLMGFGANGFCVLMSVLTGDIKLSYNGIDPLILLAFLVAVFIQSSSEEVVDRLYLYQKLRRRYRSPLVAIIFNSAVFMFMHVFNPGFTVVAGSQIFLVGVIFSLLVYYYDGLWIAFWFHTAWNYTQNIIFGLPNSGIVSEYSIFRLEAASATNGLFYDVKFGVEGSIGSSIVLLVIVIVLVMINRKKPERRDLWADAEKKAAEERAMAASAKHAK